MTAAAPGRTTVVVNKTPWPLDGVLPQLWGRSHVVVGPDGRVHSAPGFWRLWIKMRWWYGATVRIEHRSVEQDAPIRTSRFLAKGGEDEIFDHG